MPRNQPLKPHTIPLNGRLILSEDATMIGESNFSVLKNLRYKENSLQGVGGMSKINATAPSTFLKARSAHHFQKQQPVESHLLVQMHNAALTASEVLDNVTTPPSTGDFSATSLHTDASGASTGRFADAPGGNVAYCNGKEAMIWGGDQKRIARFTNFDPNGSFDKDFTDQVTNTLTDVSNVAVLRNTPGFTTWTDAVTGHAETWQSVAWSPLLSRFVAVSDGASSTGVMTSTDGEVWALGSGIPINFWRDVIWVPELELFVAVGSTGTANGVMTSPDGFVWTGHASAVANSWQSVAWSPSLSLLVAVAKSGTGNRVMTSSDGVSWIIQVSAFDNDWQSVIWADKLSIFVAVSNTGTGNRVMTSSNGTSWVTRSTPADNSWNSITWANRIGILCAISNTGSGNRVMTSANGTNWFTQTSAGDHIWVSVTWSDELDVFVAVAASGAGNLIMTSPGTSNGGTWTLRVINKTVFWSDIVWSPQLGIFSVVSATASGNLSVTSVNDGTMYLYIGSLRTLKGFRPTVSVANTTTGTTVVEYWSGLAWVAVSNISDGTASGGKPLAITGDINFDSTNSVAKVQPINSVVLYWYRLSISASVSSTTAISNITTDAEFQTVKDIWDGALRKTLSFQQFADSSFQDNTVNVFDDTFDSANSATFAALNSLTTATEYLVVGFPEQLIGLDLRFVGGAVNTVAATLLSFSYWNGSAWTDLSITDGTSENSISFAKSGIITWDPPSVVSEFKREINKGFPLFFYKLRFNKTLSSDVKMFFAAGIPAQEIIKGFRFPLLADNRLWLCSETSDKKNLVRVTAEGAPDVYNGSDTESFEFGNETEITAAAWLYNKIGDNVRSVKIFTKANETWILEGLTPKNWFKYQLSDKIGCIAPLTIQTTHIGLDQQQVAIWRGSRGIYLSDGVSIVPIHRDIRQFFNDREATSINLSQAVNEVAFIDHEEMEYHWLFADGANTTMNRELVFDIIEKKWFEVDRGTGKRLQFGMTVSDASGNTFNYGFIDTGFMERLKNGNDFDGTSITFEFRLGDFTLDGMMFETIIRKVKLIMIAKGTTVNKVTVTHQGDTKTTTTTIDAMNPKAAGKRVADVIKSSNLGGHIFHSLNFQMTTNNETFGFEPLAVGMFYKTLREDLT